MHNKFSLNTKITGAISISGLILIVSTYFILYIINSENSKQFQIEMLDSKVQLIKEEKNVTAERFTNFAKILSKIEPWILKIDIKYKNGEILNLDGSCKSDSDNFVIDYVFKDGSSYKIYYSMDSTKEYLNALLVRMLIVASAFAVLIFIFAWSNAKLLAPFKEIENYFDNFDIEDPGTLSFKKKPTLEFNQVGEAINEMVTKLKVYSKKIKTLAYKDILTHLPNRTSFKNELEAMILNESPLTMLFMDLDGFKLINDTLGHEVGDQVLIHIGDKLNFLNREDSSLYRIGGDEFVIVLKGNRSYNDIAEVSKSILNSIKKDTEILTNQLALSASIGISKFPEDANNSSDLIKKADIAMYETKAKGKDGFTFFTNDMLEKLECRILLEKDIARAVEKKEFIVHYQPQVNSKNGKVVSLEALVRWEDPVKGLVMPMQFIEYLEKSNHMIAVGEFVLDQACKDIVKLKKEGSHIKKISVNVAVIQMESIFFMKRFKEILEENNCPPEYIEVEITERVLMSNVNLILSILNALKELGISIAIDDFGTGHSSLSYLKDLPVDILKIDKSFIDNIVEDTREGVIVDSVISMGQRLGLEIIVEGVETECQRRVLKGMGCNIMQGFLFHKPSELGFLKEFLFFR